MERIESEGRQARGMLVGEDGEKVASEERAFGRGKEEERRTDRCGRKGSGEGNVGDRALVETGNGENVSVR